MSEEEIQGLKEHTNIIIEEGLDSEDDIQSLLQKWVDLYQNEKESKQYYKKQNEEKNKLLHIAITSRDKCFISKDKIRQIKEESDKDNCYQYLNFYEKVTGLLEE